MNVIDRAKSHFESLGTQSIEVPEWKDENGNPIRDEGFIKKSLRNISPIIKKGFNKLINPLSDDFSMQTPPLPNTPMPKVQMASNINPTTGLTQTQEALLSPSEQVIAKRNRTV